MADFFAALFLCWKAALEAKYKEELDEAFGIKFNNLFTITNMPIKVSIPKPGRNRFALLPDYIAPDIPFCSNIAPLVLASGTYAATN